MAHQCSPKKISQTSRPAYKTSWINAIAEARFQDPGLHMGRVLGILTQTYGSSAQFAGKAEARFAARPMSGYGGAGFG